MSRKFEDLRARPLTLVQGDGPDSFEARMKRLLASPDGQQLCAWMEQAMRTPQHPNASDAELREAEGARKAYQRVLDMQATVR